MSLSLTNRLDIVANSFSILTDNGPVNIVDKIQEDITGLPPETLNTLEELADAIGNNPAFSKIWKTKSTSRRQNKTQHLQEP